MSLYSFPPLIAGILTLAVGLVGFLSNRRAKPNATFFLVTLSVAWWLVGYALVYSLQKYESALEVARWLYVGIVFIPVTSFHFTVAITRREKLRKFIPWMYAVGATFAAMTQSNSFIPGLRQFFWGYHTQGGPFQDLFLVFFLPVMAAVLYLLASHYLRVRVAAPLEAMRIKYVFISYSISMLASTDFLPDYGIEFYPIGFLFIATHAVLTTYALVRYRLLDANVTIVRSALFIGVFAVMLVSPMVFAYWMEPVLTAWLKSYWWIVPMSLMALSAPIAPFLFLFLTRRVESRILAEQRRYQAILRQASQSMTLIKELDKLLHRTMALLTKEVGLKCVAIYLLDQRTKRFVPKVSRRWKVSSPPIFTSQDALLRYFDFSSNPAVTEELQLQARNIGASAELQRVVASLKALGAAVAVPSFVERRCIGFLVLGEKKSGTIYTPEDLQVFQVLANQAALAVENAIFYEELKRAQTDLFQTAKMADLGRMAGGMSHQVNNRFHVLTILAGVLNGLFKDLGPDPRQADPVRLDAFLKKIGETLPKMEDNALRGGEIVKTLLRFSRPSGDFKPVVLADAVSSALDVVQHRVDLTQFQVHHELPKDIPHVHGDLNLLADCFFNLISNAYDAARKKAELIAQGHIPVQAEDPAPYHGWLALRASVEQEDGKKWVVLQVKDNGVGMTPEELECLFLPFFTTKATAEKGTGLGLYVIQRIIERHSGTVSAASQYGIGTTFTIRLPAYAGVPEAPAPQGKPNA